LSGYNPDELMVVEAARHINDGDVVLVGTGLPMVAGLLAQRTHAPNMCYVVETGPVAPRVLPTPISVSDPRVMHGAVSHGSLLSSLGGVLQRGLADVSFLGGAQIDQ
jgi:glutaconate CoA-transferase subunit B